MGILPRARAIAGPSANDVFTTLEGCIQRARRPEPPGHLTVAAMDMALNDAKAVQDADARPWQLGHPDPPLDHGRRPDQSLVRSSVRRNKVGTRACFVSALAKRSSRCLWAHRAWAGLSFLGVSAVFGRWLQRSCRRSFQDMNVVCEPVQQRAQALGEHLGSWRCHPSGAPCTSVGLRLLPTRRFCAAR